MNSTFIFDFDGVIADPHIKKPNENIIRFIAQQLENDKLVAIATGRSLTWLKNIVISPISSALSSRKKLDTLFVSGEKGAVSIVYSEGIAKEYRDHAFMIPIEVKEKIKNYVKSLPGLIFDKEKYTMASVEIIGGTDKKKIAEEKKVLKQLEQWIQKNIVPLSDSIKIEPSVTAIDVQGKQVTKKISAKRLLEFIEKRKILTESFVMFGDSPSDALVCEELFAHGKQVEFIYVGKKALEMKYPFPVIMSENKFYDKAVVELLKKYQK